MVNGKCRHCEARSGEAIQTEKAFSPDCFSPALRAARVLLLILHYPFSIPPQWKMPSLRGAKRRSNPGGEGILTRLLLARSHEQLAPSLIFHYPFTIFNSPAGGAEGA
ncbi:MAG: hypothetical protein LBT00_13160 [Spirochaetaceae bacterium]|nr:hypothetical protein [Spirochaetaceae bacterium]